MSLDQSSLYEGLRIGAMLGRTPRTPYLEKQKIPEIENATVISIACRRLNMVRKTDRIYIAYISNGIGHVIYTDPVKYMLGHNWIHTTFEVECEDIEIRFNGRCVQNGPEGREFITEGQPWVFWVHDGRCRGQLLGNLGWMEFASENCTRVTSIVDYAKDWISDGKGMILFLLLDGDIYYRKLINGNWYDAEYLTGTPENVKWTDISAFRTWDYRIGIQGLSTNGTVHEIFSQFEGFGKRNYENIYIDNLEATGILTRVYYHDGFETEHLYISNIICGAPYGGLYQIGLPVIIQAYNVEDSNHDWGKIAVFVFDKHLVASDVEAQYNRFKIIDSQNHQFVAKSAMLAPDGKTVILTFINFNRAINQCTGMYSPGTITSMAGTVLESTSINWVPQNLVIPSDPLPEPYYITNIGTDLWDVSDGACIKITFTQPLVDYNIDNNSCFIISWQEYDSVPNGVIINKAISPEDISLGDNAYDLILTLPWNGRFNNTIGNIHVAYDGSDNLTGFGGPVELFNYNFVPHDLIAKPNQNDIEHINISDVLAIGDLIQIYHKNAYENEHIDISSIIASGTLTHIDDL